MTPLVDYYQETFEGQREPLALFYQDRQRINDLWHTRAFGRLWHITYAKRYGERWLTEDEVASLHKIKVAHALDANPLVVEAGTAYVRQHYQNKKEWR